jgi:UDP-N-acetylglucosamine--dolichyl-phosphate N-acetylglucosaminephosphotransferase
MHSGFNGLQTGLSSILLATIIIKSSLDGKYDNLLVPCAFLGGILAFWYYNKYPASIFEGNIGSLSIGSIIGIILVLKDYFFFGIFILIPHIIDFFMLLYLKYKGLPFVKFGMIDEEGILVVPNPVKMKFLFPYYNRMTEPQAVNYLYMVTVVFCTTGLLVF